MTTTKLAPPTFTPAAALSPGRRHAVPGRGGDYNVKILPFGPGNRYAHVLFEEPDGRFFDSRVLLPDDLRDMAEDEFPWSHLEPDATVAHRARAGRATPEEVRERVREQGREEPAESKPEETDPEAVQSAAEAAVFNEMNSKELVEATLGKIFGDEGPKIEPGTLIDVTFLDDDVSRPLREVIYLVTADGRPIFQSSSNFLYDANKFPRLIITRAVKNLEVRHYRRVLVQQTLKSTSLSAGLNLALSAPTRTVTSGPRPGGEVHSKGVGTGIGFNFSMTKTYARLRIEAELEMEEKLGGLEILITEIPPIGS